ncbi:acyl-CoA mutase large subunit family protein [Archaeoglobus fulgidus]|jgi:methylmalonyl-CoA mutase N-terminal domain/subunit|uniref:Methylmalonyl-CoA mutase, subunit alpha, N-terminus (McmA1) n=3 Tax=Archaeoglobus fulgidus TaxID=2234 RepID=O28068_ARCFU|nr:methylmalonyl-CoA mutase family protein [Archaeoglobus fulgidus]AAB89037.1 methylmalonyl-CoA mutase, subunit alpha, N-terminus (mcmA1) [Archaeoglobus fulgidus DSM 4304]AIG99205.1 methylmalonyl-CoA mutase N-terminal domain protein [Archaeoglobus fulgidus DSM 8774]KUJ93618.1 MAG: Methylmalonyl-CoA mutase, subunit alpha, N-terminus (McmA1) [Archaeoglobus fulgidus]KUK07321.1 MAG: Methylmalonyl-CoA mutase, subunit alpha, N-terminus (McmA1) [Archaeoglobus fulgidus]
MNKKEWEEKYVKPLLERSPERKKEFKTSSGIVVDRLYTPEDVEIDYENKLGYPGVYPFTRGVYPTMYRGRLWTMRQYAGFGTAEETNRRYRYLLEQGQTGLSVAFDLPTQIGYDSDHPMALGEVGKVGVAIDTIEDMEILFNGIPLGKVSTSMTINSTCAQILSMYVAVAEKQGVERANLRGTVQNDMLKEYIARGTYIFPPEPSLRLATDIIMFCAKEMPKWNSISISGYHMEEAGATPVQEVAFTLADGITYVEKVIERGMDVDSFAPRLSFFFAAGNNFLEEIAKFRAARRLWARIMKERFNAKNPRSMMLRFHVQTAGCTLTAQQPENNIVRVALQALAAVLGGCQSLHTNSFDEALCLPTEKAVRIALRTQQIIAEESGVADVVDPLGGSYYIEWLTDRIEEEAMKYIEKIDEMGGMIKAIESGYVQREIQKSAYEKQKAIDEGEITVVGVNKYQIEEEIQIELLRVDKAVVEKQIRRLQEFRKNRDAKKVEEALDRLRKAAEKEDENLMPYVLDAVKARATLGEMTDALRDVFGEFRAPEIF